MVPDRNRGNCRTLVHPEGPPRRDEASPANLTKENRMIQKLKNFWSSLPHPVQALVVAFVGGCGAEIGNIAADFPNICVNAVCLKRDIGLIVGAGLVAARAFYMLPNKAKSTPPPQPPSISRLSE